MTIFEQCKAAAPTAKWVEEVTCEVGQHRLSVSAEGAFWCVAVDGEVVVSSNGHLRGALVDALRLIEEGNLREILDSRLTVVEAQALAAEIKL